MVNFAATALMMQLGYHGVFVRSGIFKSGDPTKRAKAIVQATTHFNDQQVVTEASTGLGQAMVGINVEKVDRDIQLAERDW